MSGLPPLSDLNQATLTPLVCAVLNSSQAEVIEWQVAPILAGRASPSAVYRVSGTAKSGTANEDTANEDTAKQQAQILPWSLIVKIARPPAANHGVGNQASADPTDAYYWKRELLLLQSGLFNKLPDGFVVPRCYQVEDSPQEGRIWMEDVRDELDGSSVDGIWPLTQYGHVARHFGRFNGAYLAGEPLPTWPWLNKDFLLRRIQRSPWPDFWQNYPSLRQTSALVQRGWSDELADGVNRIWEDRERFLRTLERLPQTLMHNDAGRKNLFARRDSQGNPETVVIDWGAITIGPVGGELGVIVSQPVYWLNGVRPEQLPELDELAFTGYMQGLREAGWQGDSRLARLGYTTTFALRGSIAILVVEWTARDEARRTWLEDVMGHSVEELADTFRGFRGYVVACADEARQLMASPALSNQPG